MVLSKRIIARLDIKGNRLIKGIRFEGLRVIGDPYEAALKYSQNGADEILYLDAVASLYGRNSLKEVLRKTSRKAFIPFTAGGGIRSLDDAKNLLSSGADKIAINTAAIQNPNLITELAEKYGSQCVVISIQARRNLEKNYWEAMTSSGREKSGKDVLDWALEAQKMGAGEILLTSIDQDGTCMGPDEKLIEYFNDKIKIPLIIGGGFSNITDIEKSLSLPKISGISIGAALHKNLINLNEVKDSLIEKSILVRKVKNDSLKINFERKILSEIKIGIIDYGMGNLQSLFNALSFLGADVFLTNQIKELEKADLIALPGVGAFEEGIRRLKKYKLDKFIFNKSEDGFPMMGICLGMQMLFQNGEEFQSTNGLGIMEGDVTLLPKYDNSKNRVNLPHIGWNLIKPENNEENLEEIYQYFVHSYAASNKKNSKNEILYTCNYGDKEFIAAIRYKNTIGFQFHPERSGAEGLKLLSDIISSLVDSTQKK